MCLRASFKTIWQQSGETTVQVILEIKRLARLCNFGASTDILAFEKIKEGIASSNLWRKIPKIAAEFSIQKALDLAIEERVDHALELAAPSTDAVLSPQTPLRDLPYTLRNVSPFLAASQAGAICSPTATAPSATGASNTGSPASQSTRVGACFPCGSFQHWADAAARPPRNRTCERCRKRGHYESVSRFTRDVPTDR
ncbi:hypothetical protein HPB51_014446 [Rhipicephalus microplus]|uniref:Tick transposon n=1 Tax=Rhipicephalus microplus TaxID=6941 RepID=A0A9J6D543_RHIMP|nr:hypothetical protein HPB51_014446 [Rhipicephalus microplus]